MSSRSASKAATAAAGSSTPAGARPAAASCGRSRPPRRPTRASTSSKANEQRRSCDDGGVQLENRAITARATILATGGAAALWSRTTNPPGSFGSGLLLARQAGATLADLEFTQFHPTAVVGLKGREGFLISEAVRGEGATLHGPDGERFVDELSPRDAVARAIFQLLQRTGATHAELDMTMVDEGRFPNIVGALREAGLDPMTQRVPVAPASHYVMGGIVTDLARARPRPPVRRRRVRLHRPARRQPARLELAQRVLRLRPPSGAEGPRRAAPRRAASRTPATRSRRRAARPARPCGGTPASSATRTASTALSHDPHPLARLVAVSAKAREETRGAARPRGVPRARPAPRPPAHAPRPRQRDPALRDMALDALLDRLGRRAHHEHARVLRGLRRARGLRPPHARSATTRRREAR